jgi:hypothetical protein
MKFVDHFIIIAYNSIMNDNTKETKPADSDTYYFGGLTVKKIEVVEDVFAIAQSPINCVIIGPFGPFGPFGP